MNTIFSLRRWKEMLLISLFHFWSLLKQNGGNILPDPALGLKWAWSLGTRSHSGLAKRVLQDTNTPLSSSMETRKMKAGKENLLPMQWVLDIKWNKFWFYETHLRLNHPLALKNFHICTLLYLTFLYTIHLIDFINKVLPVDRILHANLEKHNCIWQNANNYFFTYTIEIFFFL